MGTGKGVEGREGGVEKVRMVGKVGGKHRNHQSTPEYTSVYQITPRYTRV
jgi:hypothetical protein